MADPFTLLFLMLRPNSERERWTAVQDAWRALAEVQGIELEEVDRADTWPVTKRRLGAVDGLVLTIGVSGHTETYLEADDRTPIDGLTCDMGPASLLARLAIKRFVTKDKDFDAEVTARANDAEKAGELLGEGLRASLRRMEAPYHLRYHDGRARLVWSATSLDPSHLEAALSLVLAACRRDPAAPYR